MDALSLIVIGFQLDEGRVTCGDIRHGNPSRPSETVIGGDQWSRPPVDIISHGHWL